MANYPLLITPLLSDSSSYSLNRLGEVTGFACFTFSLYDTVAVVALQDNNVLNQERGFKLEPEARNHTSEKV